MSLIAELRLTSPKLPLTESMSSVSDMRLRVEQAIAEHPQRPILFLWASGDDFEVFEAALNADPTVESATRIEDVGERRLYRVQISEQAEVVMYPTDLEVGASRLAVTATARGLDIRMRFPDRDALSRFRQLCRERDISLSLRGLYEGATRPLGEGTGCHRNNVEHSVKHPRRDTIRSHESSISANSRTISASHSRRSRSDCVEERTFSFRVRSKRRRSRLGCTGTDRTYYRMVVTTASAGE